MTRLALGLLALALLAGCGIRGGLEQPPPLWGDDARTAASPADASEEEEDDELELPR